MPLIEDRAERARIVATLRDLSAGLDAWFAANPDAKAVHADRALMRYYLAQDDTVADPDDVAGRSLAEALARLGECGACLYGGLAHDAWMIAHLTDEDALAQRLEHALTLAGSAELVGGFVGAGVLAIERGSSALATRILDRLEQGIEVSALGLAHGIPGVAAVLARFIRDGLAAERSARLLDAALADYAPLVDDRVAWCHGDLGTAVALHAAACARGRDDWRVQALALARDVARRPVGASDPGFCHGTAGGAHLLHRMYRATGDALLGDAARAWFAQLLADRRPARRSRASPRGASTAAGSRPPSS